MMNEPIITLFSSQSTEGEMIVPEDELDDDEFMVSFADLQFDLEEDNIPDNMPMSRKNFKILNKNLNSLLQIQVDTGGKNFVSGVEVEFMLTALRFQW
ncbi:unnamed protein product [Lactuca saligna]|uniref:Uncharacterized protein n=1 Tax=Lactuca saligna TaxID=75948 RepID=A0AA35Z1Y1_LACSI|nr:unnamed protein product [Lactuca saligna]